MASPIKVFPIRWEFKSTEALAERIRHQAALQGITTTEFIREALAAYTEAAQVRQKKGAR